MTARTAPLEFSALAAGACAAVSGVAHLVLGLRAGAALSEEHGYLELGYVVGDAAVRAEALRDAWGAVIAPASIACGAALFAGCVLSAVGAERVLRLRNPWTSAAWFGFATALLALVTLDRSRDWIGARDLASTAAAALAWTGLFRALASSHDEGESRAWRSSTAAIALFAAAPAWFAAVHDIAWRTNEPASWARVAGVLVGASALAFAGWRIGPPTSRASSARRLVIALALGAVVAAPLAAGELASPGAKSPRRASKPLNVLVIGIDTLRSDATSIAGSGPLGRDTTPRLRELSTRGLRFERAISQAPWTLPAFASMFTGRYPLEHGAHRITSRLSRSETTLAETLREYGYRTAAVTSHVYLDRRHGLDQGFESFDASNAKGHEAVTSSDVTDLAIEALEAADGRPFFLFAHYFDAHYQYRDHSDSRWADGYDGWFAEQNDFENLLKIRHLLEERDVDWLRALYHEEIAFVDAQIGRLLDALRVRGLEGNTLVIVTADHGEEFGERGNFGHTISLHEEQLRVPLIVVGPEVAPGVSQRVVETRGLHATVLGELGAETPSSGGGWLRTASAESAGGAQLDAARAFSCVWLDDSKLSWGKRIRAVAVHEGRWKLIHDVTRGRKLLFDLDADPGERRNVLDSEPEVSTRLEALLEPWMEEQKKRLRRPQPAAMDARTAQALKSLGYL